MEVIMTRNSLVPFGTGSLFRSLDDLTTTFDRMFDDKSVSGNYPPHNIYEADGDYIVEMAVAGFKKEDITVTHHRKNTPEYLEIEGKRPDSVEREYLHKGIAQRDFSKRFMFKDLDVSDVSLVDGMLKIVLEQRELPEDKKPLEIEVK